MKRMQGSQHSCFLRKEPLRLAVLCQKDRREHEGILGFNDIRNTVVYVKKGSLQMKIFPRLELVS